MTGNVTQLIIDAVDLAGGATVDALRSNPSSYASFLAASRLIRRGRCRWRGRFQQVRLRRFDSANRPC